MLTPKGFLVVGLVTFLLFGVFNPTDGSDKEAGSKSGTSDDLRARLFTAGFGLGAMGRAPQGLGLKIFIGYCRIRGLTFLLFFLCGSDLDSCCRP